MRSGIKFEILKYILVFNFGNVDLSDIETIAWNTLKQHYINTSAIKIVEFNKYISKARLIPKAIGGYRLVVDLRFINEH